MCFVAAHYKAERLLNSKDRPQSWQEEITSSNPTSMSKKDNFQAQSTSSENLLSPKRVSSAEHSERPSCHLLSSAMDSSKTQFDSLELPRKKKVWFSDTSGTDNVKKLHTFYLNGNAEMWLLSGVQEVVR